ncbi:MAG: hypothetical protein COS89_07490 [Deltaproteobacteria bacterium CG07_land_8_20_14_0_80_38_7]|nr:MAG: hypothetical protein COS89_07490 [Deltaproteobacteria bacterium CG07_land_8_20_14_0_80_38_7]
MTIPATHNVSSTPSSTFAYNDCAHLKTYDELPLPQRYYQLNDIFSHQLRDWEHDRGTSISYDDSQLKIATIYKFSMNFIKGSVDLEADYANVINNNFWDII